MVANFSATILVYPFTRQMCSPLSKFRYSTIVQADQKNKETPDFKGFLKKIERVMGIEPTYPAWKAGVLPLNYTRISVGVTGFEPATSWSQTRRSSQAEPHPVFCFRVVISVTQIVLYISPLYMSTTFLNFFQKNSSKYLPHFGKPVKSGFPDLLSSYLYTVLSSTSGCFPFSNFITM